jgi:transposase
MDLLNEFVEEDSEVEGEFSVIINGESDSDSSRDGETPSDLGPSDLGPSNLDPSDLGPSDSGASKEGSTRPPSKSIPGSHYHSIGTRMLALTRKRDGVPIHFITQELGMSKSALYKVQEKAISRGWSPDPINKQVVEPHHVDDTPRSGRPRTSTTTAEFILKTMLKNSTTRGWSCNRIASEVSGTPGWQPVSPSTVYRVLKEHSYRVYKRTIKLGLTKEQIKEHLK